MVTKRNPRTGEEEAVIDTERNARILVTSTIGHCFGLTFKEQRGLKPAQMYDAECEKQIEEGVRKNRVIEHLQEL